MAFRLAAMRHPNLVIFVNEIIFHSQFILRDEQPLICKLIGWFAIARRVPKPKTGTQYE